nr:hypothetical protein [Oenococcus oeni]
MENQMNLHIVGDNKIPILNNLINSKIDYLNSIKEAIDEHNYLLIYELLDSARYNEKIRQWPHADPNYFLSNMTETIQPELSEFLASKLLSFIRVHFPFLYFREIKTGVYEIIFGRWPSARTFGILDIIRIEFIFDEVAVNELKNYMDNSKSVEEQNAQLNELHRANQLYAAKKRSGFEADIERNNLAILKLEKDRAVLQLEREQIEKYSGSFQHFVDQAGNLYVDYLSEIQKENK